MSHNDDSLEITCREVQQQLQSGTPPMMLDCRNPDEHQFVSLSGATLIPMRELPDRIGEIERFRQQEIVVFCHHGGRSRRVAAWLQQQGFSARTMTGGIDQWAVEIDPTLPRYG